MALALTTNGPTGVQRASRQSEQLRSAGLTATVRVDDGGGLIRLGPLAHGAAWIALEAFLGRPVSDVAVVR